MKNLITKQSIILFAALTLLISFTALDALAHGSRYGQQGQYCPNCGTWQGHRGMMGSGMMGPQGMHHGYYGNNPQYDRQYRQEPLTQEQTKSLIQDQFGLSQNPNLKIGDIEDKGAYFQADIVTKNNSLVDKLRVNKNTGYIRSIY